MRKGRAVEYVKGFSSERDEMTEEDLKQAELHLNGIKVRILTNFFEALELALDVDTIIVFAAADDLLDLPGGKVLPDAYWPDEGRAHDALVLEGQVKQNGNALIGAALIFTGDVEKDVVPTAAPVRRQALPYPLRPFGEQKKHQ